MRVQFFLVVLSFFFLCRVSWGQFETNESKAFHLASETNRPVLLVFAGSDWCAPCIRFEENILTESTFVAFAHDHLVILKADFPQRKKLPEELQKQNDALAEQYNPKGVFPKLVLLEPDKSVMATLLYTNQSSDEFIAEVKSFLTK